MKPHSIEVGLWGDNWILITKDGSGKRISEIVMSQEEAVQLAGSILLRALRRVGPLTERLSVPISTDGASRWDRIEVGGADSDGS